MGDVRIGQVWGDLDPRHVGRRVEIVEVNDRHALVALLDGRTWPGHAPRPGQPDDDRRAEPGRRTRVSLTAFRTGPEDRVRYELVQEPGAPCAYCRRFGIIPAGDDTMCECERWCGASECADHPDSRARELSFTPSGELVEGRPADPAATLRLTPEQTDHLDTLVQHMRRDLLTFQRVSATNRARCQRWHPGFPADDGWTGADWSNAMQGEAGEAGNVVKKLRRGEVGLPGAVDPDREVLLGKLSKEIGDTFMYLDLLAQFYGLDLAACVVHAFNQISEREGFPERL